jgi:crotonobetainyl-CoA:carnitine CoA-transferase CaiB-like acyl-CoA transferase
MVREVEDPTFGRPVLQTGVVPLVVEAPGTVRWAGPAIGAHTDEILSGLLGMDAAAIAGLRGEGVIG